MPSTTSVGPTGTSYIDGVISGTKWATGTLSYSFPTSASFYGSGYGSGEPSTGFEPLNAQQQDAVRDILKQYSSFANVTFGEVTESSSSHGDLRFAESDLPSTAWAYYPTTREEGGDVWFNNSRGYYDAPTKGNYAYTTILHEVGHALGLKHAHEASGSFAAMPVSMDSMENTVMSYRSYVGASTTTGYTNESWGYAQTLMTSDIAALQKMYGANFNINSGNSIYAWSPTSGEMTINGVPQGAPGGNRVFMAIWDGNGIDTYDFTAYSNGVAVDLNPGAWTTASAAQLARLHYNGSQIAAGNIANAYLYNNDIRSLIENASGGTGNDILTGNVAANTLRGGAGDDALTGAAGNDVLEGGAGSDTAVFSGLRSQYAVTLQADGSLKLVDGRSGSPDGTDIAREVENFRFADRTYTLAELTPVTLSTPDEPSEPSTPTVPGVTLNGNSRSNTLTGGAGNDTISGGGGNDTLKGGGGNDTINGGSGTDKAVYSGARSDYTVTRLSDGSFSIADRRTSSPDGTDTVKSVEKFVFSNRTYSSSELLSTNTSPTAPTETDQPSEPTVAGVTISGNSRSNTLSGGAGNDTISGGGGNDTLKGGGGNDTINGGSGTDKAIYSGTRSDYTVTRLSDGSFSIADERTSSPDGTDTVKSVERFVFSDRTYSSSELLSTNSSPTALTETDQPSEPTVAGVTISGNSRSNTLSGGAGNDKISGGGGKDTLKGGGGDDVIDGGRGTDIATYSGQSDAFTWSYEGGRWIVVDGGSGFEEGTDRLTSVEYLRFADREVHLSASGVSGWGNRHDEFDLENAPLPSAADGSFSFNFSTITGGDMPAADLIEAVLKGDFGGLDRTFVADHATEILDMIESLHQQDNGYLML